MADLLDTPSRLLRRVQAYDEVELPSLPAIRHDIDFDDDTLDIDQDSDRSIHSQNTVVRNNDHNDSDNGEDDNYQDELQTPLARISSPARQAAHHFTSLNSPLARDSSFGSTSLLSVDQISYSHSIAPTIVTSTPLPSRGTEDSTDSVEPYSSVEVGRGYSREWDSQRSHLQTLDQSQHEYSSLERQAGADESVAKMASFSFSAMTTPLKDISSSSTRLVDRSHDGGRTPLGLVRETDRVPSLSRSAISVSDSSGEASTPEGPVRLQTLSAEVSMALDQSQDSQISYEAPLHDEISAGESTDDRVEPLPEFPRRRDSTPLQDVSNLHQPTTPGQFSTPRALLDDMSRRKSHVLAVLNSTKTTRVRGTPHPLGRVMSTPASSSRSRYSETFATPVSTLAAERSQMSSVNDSFVSIASSADLTSDRRAAGNGIRFAHANSSFPAILLPTGNGAASPGGPLTGIGGEHRANGVKIHKHLNAMNKQLLEVNADLAREAESWRHECERLSALLRDSGIDFEEPNFQSNENSSLRLPEIQSTTFEANRQGQSAADSQSHQAEDNSRPSSSPRNSLQQESIRIRELEELLELAEQDRQTLHTEFTSKTATHARQFEEICAEYEAQVQDLKIELDEALTQIDRLKSSSPLDGVGHLDQSHSDGTTEELASALSRLDRAIESLAEKDEQILDLERKLSEADVQASEAADQLIAFQELAAGSTGTNGPAVGDVSETDARHSHNKSSASAQSVIHSLESRLHSLATNHSRETERLTRDIDDMQQQLDDVNGALTAKNIELDRLRAKSDGRPLIDISKITSAVDAPSMNSDEFITALEDRLDEAYREIGRLKHELAASPVRKSAIAARDSRIQALETRLEMLSTASNGLASTKAPSFSASPLVSRALAALKTPKTPGPMKEFSFLQTTVGDNNEPLLQAQIEELQRELDLANHQLDQNFEQLERADLGSTDLRSKLAAAEEKIRMLEAERQTLLSKRRSSSSANRGSIELQTGLAKERSDLELEIGQLNESLSRARLEGQREMSALRAQMDSAIRDLQDHLDEEVRLKRQAVQNLDHHLHQQKRDMEHHQGVIAENARVVSALQKSNDAHMAVIDEQRDRLAYSEDRIRSLTREMGELSLERARVLKDLQILEGDLKMQRKESSKFGQEMAKIMSEQSRAHAPSQELGLLRSKYLRAKEALRDTQLELATLREAASRSHHDGASSLTNALSQQKAEFKARNRELAAQIRYLKAKFTRESTFRNSLCLQKRFLVMLVGGMSLNEQASLRVIANLGYSVPSQPLKPTKSFKTVAMAVVGIVRARRAAEKWRVECMDKGSHR